MAKFTDDLWAMAQLGLTANIDLDDIDEVTTESNYNNAKQEYFDRCVNEEGFLADDPDTAQAVEDAKAQGLTGSEIIKHLISLTVGGVPGLVVSGLVNAGQNFVEYPESSWKIVKQFFKSVGKGITTFLVGSKTPVVTSVDPVDVFLNIFPSNSRSDYDTLVNRDKLVFGIISYMLENNIPMAITRSRCSDAYIASCKATGIPVSFRSAITLTYVTGSRSIELFKDHNKYYYDPTTFKIYTSSGAGRVNIVPTYGFCYDETLKTGPSSFTSYVLNSTRWDATDSEGKALHLKLSERGRGEDVSQVYANYNFSNSMTFYTELVDSTSIVDDTWYKEYYTSTLALVAFTTNIIGSEYSNSNSFLASNTVAGTTFEATIETIYYGNEFRPEISVKLDPIEILPEFVPYYADNSKDIDLLNRVREYDDNPFSGDDDRLLHGRVRIPIPTKLDTNGNVVRDNSVYTNVANKTKDLNDSFYGTTGTVAVAIDKVTGEEIVIKSEYTALVPVDTSISNVAKPTPGYSNLSVGVCTFTNIWLADAFDLQMLASSLYSTEALTVISKAFSDPMDCIISLSYMPIIPQTAGQSVVKLGSFTTNAQMYRITKTTMRIDCGTVYYGASPYSYSSLFADYNQKLAYEPYTNVTMFLPFVGFVPLTPSEIMDRYVNVTYEVSLTTGVCLATITTSNPLGGQYQYPIVIGQYEGNCKTELPITGTSYASLVSALAKTTVDVGLAVATGGALAPLVASDVGGVAGSINPSHQRNGGFSGNGGCLGVLKPFITIDSTKGIDDKSFRTTSGIACNETMTLGVALNIEYFKASKVMFNNEYGDVVATTVELKELEEILLTGVRLN